MFTRVWNGTSFASEAGKAHWPVGEELMTHCTSAAAAKEVNPLKSENDSSKTMTHNQ